MAETNYTQNIVYSGTSEADDLYNYASGVTISALAGNDYIENSNDGDNKGTAVSINAGIGDDTVKNTEQNVTIAGGAGDDSISNEGATVSINAQGGADYVENSGEGVTILGGDDADTISNTGNTASISGGAGNDSIENSGSSVTINGGDGADEIYNNSSSATIDGGAGDDSISNGFDNVSITGGAANDSIYNTASNVTIGGGAGGDSIENYADNVTFQYTGGNDVITGFNETSTLQLMSGSITSASLTVMDEGDLDAVFKIGTSNLTLKDFDGTNQINVISSTGEVKKYIIPTYKGTANDDIINISDYSNISIYALGGDDNISNSSSLTTIDGGTGGDYITNYGLSVAIEGGGGSDTVDNSATYATINGGADNDSISNSGSSSVIDGGAGDDYILNKNDALNSTISGGDGSDTVDNSATYVTINGGADNDSISNSGDSALIDGGAGNDYIYNMASNVSIGGGAGVDSIENYADNVTFQYTSGNDVITGFNETSTLQLMSGSIASASLDGTDASLKVGNYILTLENFNTTNKINVMDSAGSVKEYSIPIYAGTADDDNISNSNFSNISINALAGDDTVENYGSSVTINGGDDNDSVDNKNEALNVVIYGVNGSDTLENLAAYATIHGDADDDSISNSGTSSALDGGEGNDYISNTGDGLNVIIEGGGGSDTLDNLASYTTINGGADDDSITNGGDSVLIDGGEGNDYIFNTASLVSIGGGAGDDTVENSGGESVVFQYSGGSDTIIGFNETSTLQLMSTDSFSAYVDGTDAFFVVGNDTLTIKDYAEQKINLMDSAGNAEEYLIPEYRGTDDDDNIGNGISDYTNISINALGGDDVVDNAAPSVTIDGGTGNDYITNRNEGLNVVIEGGGGSDTVDNLATYTTINGGDDDDSISNSGDSALIDGGAGNDSITNVSSYVTIGGGAGDDSIENSNGESVVFQYSGGSDTITGFNETSTLQIISTDSFSAYVDGTDAFFVVGNDTLTIKDYTEQKINLMDSAGNTEEYLIPEYRGTDDDDNITIPDSYTKISINALSGSDTIDNSATSATIEAGLGDDYISNSGTNILINGGSGADNIENNSNYATISGDADDDIISNEGSAVSINGGGGSNFINLLGGSAVTVNVSAGDDTISISSGIESVAVEDFGIGDLIQLGFSTESLGAVDGGIKAGDLTISGISLAQHIQRWENTSSGTNYIEGNTAGAFLFEDQYSVSYISGGESTLFTIGGIVSTLGISVDTENKKVSVMSMSALGSASVTINNDYELELGENIPAPETLDEIWDIDGTSAIYRAAGGRSAGYLLEDNVINYYPEILGESLIELSGVSVDEDNQLDFANNRTVLISAANFAGSAITVNSHSEEYDFELNQGDYSGKTFIGSASNDFITDYGSNIKFELGAGYDSIEIFGESATIDAGAGDDSVVVGNDGLSIAVSLGGGSDVIDNNALYVEIYGGEGNDTITNGSDSATIYGDEGDDIISNTGDNVILDAGDGDDSIYANGNNLEIKLGKGADSIDLNSSNPVIEYGAGDGSDVIYNLSGDATLSVNLTGVSLGGYSTTEDNDIIFQVDEETITFQNSSNNLISLATAEGNKFILNGEASNSITTGEGNNTIVNNALNVTISAGAGNDTVTLNSDEDDGGNMFVYSASDGKDVIYNFTNDDSIKFADDLTFQANIKNNDVIFKVGTGRITFKNAALNNKTISVYDSAESLISSQTYNTGGIQISDEVTEISETATEYTATNSVSTVDASNNFDGVKITGNESYGNSIVGGYGNDTIEGSTLDDTIRGGKGRDVFIYSGGNDIIEDYEENRDKIRVSDTLLAYESFAIDENKNLILNLSGYTLTINNGADKAVNLDSVVNYYTTDGIFNKTKKAVSLTGTDGTFSAKKYSKLVTIDGSEASAMEIIGNNKANSIVASSGGSTLQGGKGRDTLVGGDGADTFVYNDGEGNDVIQNYSDNDVISLGADTGIDDIYMNNNDAVIEIGSGKITVKNTSQFVLTAEGNDSVFNNGLIIEENSIAKPLVSSDTGINLSDYNVTIFNAGNVTNKFTVTGTDSADSLVGGKKNDKLYGGAGSDSIVGGKGNDSLWGETGKDTFIFHAGDGNDVIKDFNSGGTLDELLLYDRNETKNINFSKSKFNSKAGTLTLTVQGSKLTFEGITSSSTFAINGSTYSISGKKLVQNK